MTEAQWVTVFDAVACYRWDRAVDLSNKEGLTERGKVTGTNIGRTQLPTGFGDRDLKELEDTLDIIKNALGGLRVIVAGRDEVFKRRAEVGSI
jgi:hypothetical protein